MSEIDTLNRCLIAVQSGQVIVQRPPHRLTPEHACELAAWLVCMAETACLAYGNHKTFDADDHFAKALNMVRNS